MSDTFEQWFRKVDQTVASHLGLGASDLADRPYRDWFDDGLTVAEAAREVEEGAMSGEW